jgi:hypothetical protein
MDVQAEMDRLMPEVASVVDPDLATYLRELVAVGEAEIALVTLLENAPQAVTVDLVDEAERHFRGSNEYVAPQALTAIAKYRARHAA